VPWTATLVNGGHEYLIARAWDLAADPLSTPEWDASLSRHIGQRNIHVASAGEIAGRPLTCTVGLLYGAPAAVQVERVTPTSMPWLQLRHGRGQFPDAAFPTGAVLLSPPSPIGGARPQVPAQPGSRCTWTAADRAPHDGPDTSTGRGARALGGGDARRADREVGGQHSRRWQRGAARQAPVRIQSRIEVSICRCSAIRAPWSSTTRTPELVLL
jgi:hypothetical protein